MIIHNRALGYAPYAVMPCMCRGRGVCIECQKWLSGRNLKALGSLVAGDVRGFGFSPGVLPKISIPPTADFNYVRPNDNLRYALGLTPAEEISLVPPAPKNVGRADGVMVSGLSIRPNECVVSPNGKYQLVFTKDRELVVKGPVEPVNSGFLWRHKTNYGPRAYVHISGGLLTITDPDSNRFVNFYWNNVATSPNAYGVMQDDGNFVLYAPGGPATWATGSYARAAGCSVDDLRKKYNAYGLIDPPGMRNEWCECKFLPGSWMDMAGVDALTKCKKDTFPNFAPWTNEGAGQRDLPTGEGLLYAFIRNNREPLEQELELDYLCSLMFTDTARFAAIVVYAGMHAGGALFLGPLGPLQTAANFLIGGVVSIFDEGKRIRYLQKLAKAWFNIGMPLALGGLFGAAMIAMSTWVGATFGTLIGFPREGTTLGLGFGILTGGAALLAGIAGALENAALDIEAKHGKFRPPWARRERSEIKWTEEQRLKWEPSPAAVTASVKYWYPARLGLMGLQKRFGDPTIMLDPMAFLLEGGAELAANLIPKTPIPDPEVEAARILVKAMGRLSTPLVKAFVEKKTEALEAESTWGSIGLIFEEASKITEHAPTKERLIDWADFFILFKSSISRAAGYFVNPTTDNFKKLVCCEEDSAFDRFPQAFVKQNMSALSKALDAIIGKPINGRVLTIEERAGFASVFVELNASNLAKFLRLVARLIGFFREGILALRSLGWDVLNDVVNFFAGVLQGIVDALMQARDFILSLINAAKNAPPLPEPKPEEKPKTKTKEKPKEDGLLAALLLGAGGGFVVGGPPGALVGAGAAVALSSK